MSMRWRHRISPAFGLIFSPSPMVPWRRAGLYRIHVAHSRRSVRTRPRDARGQILLQVNSDTNLRGKLVEFGLTADQEMLRDATDRLIASKCTVSEIRNHFGDPHGFPDDYLRMAAELGWFAMFIPEELGGGTVSGNSVLDAAMVGEIRGRHIQPGPFTMSNVVSASLFQYGSTEQRSQHLPKLATADEIATWVGANDLGDWTNSAIVASSVDKGFVLNGTG